MVSARCVRDNRAGRTLAASCCLASLCPSSSPPAHSPAVPRLWSSSASSRRFEGRGRELGYAVLPEIKAAAAEANVSGALGSYRVLVVAFNDSLDPVTAEQQAQALALDPDVVAVVGPFSAETAAVAAPILQGSNIPVQPVPSGDPLDGDFATQAAEAKAAARTLLQALAADIQAHGRPTRLARPTP